MTDTAPAVALLFDDDELGNQLREALRERGARIVHEGDVDSFNRDLLQQVGVEVVVVNLDDDADEALDRLYESIDGDRPRVVFNDAAASRGLSGWDRARWARHLAVKVLDAGDIDPPRPASAQPVEVPTSVSLDTSGPGSADGTEAAATSLPAAAGVTPASAEPEHAPVAEMEDVSVAVSVQSAPMLDEHARRAREASESLAAELEALLASGSLPEQEGEEVRADLSPAAEEAAWVAHDDDFRVAGIADESSAFASTGAVAVAQAHDAGSDAAVEKLPAFELDHLEAPPEAEAMDAGTTPDAIPVDPLAARASAPGAPDEWSLVNDDEPLPGSAAGGKTDASAFGIEKLSAADFLAPDGASSGEETEPVMNLELVSMEEAVAPQAYEPGHDREMLLDDLGGALSHIVLLGATVDGTDSVCAFLAALPADSRLTFVHTQHLGGQPATALVEVLGRQSALPVRLAEEGQHARAGEVLVVTDGQQTHVRRDGSIRLQPISADLAHAPSIDANFSAAADVFGRSALAIVFAGGANDAVAGSQAIHDRGGQVWVESTSGEHYADMVSAVLAERLVSFSGTPHELAAHLNEVFS